MSTPPVPPPLPEDHAPQPPARGRSSLAKLAIGFAVTIVVTFGLCSASLMHSTNAISGNTLPAAIIIEAICVIGLIVVGFTALFRSAGRKE